MHHCRAASETRARTRAFDWRALGVLLLAIALAWLGAVAFTDLNQLAPGEPDATAQVAR